MMTALVLPSHHQMSLACHPMNIAPAALQRWTSIMEARIFLPLGSTEIGCKVGLWRAPDACLLWVHSWFFTALILASNMPPHCLTLAREGWPVVCYQRPSGGPQDVIRRPPWPQTCLCTASKPTLQSWEMFVRCPPAFTNPNTHELINWSY